jgi:predicted small metal-binding protein
MYKLSCKDLGAKDCDFVAEGNSAEETVDKMMKHVDEAHPEQVAKIKREDLVKKVKSEDEEKMEEEF